MSLIFAIGDIHGSLRKLQSLMQRCERYAEGRPMAFIFLGDYIDRGPESAGVVGYLLDLQSRMPERVIALKGNHEAMVLGVIDGTVPAHYWLAQGGTETLQSYGASSAGELPNAMSIGCVRCGSAITTDAASSSTPASIRKSPSMRSRTPILFGSGSHSSQTGATTGASSSTATPR